MNKNSYIKLNEKEKNQKFDLYKSKLQFLILINSGILLITTQNDQILYSTDIQKIIWTIVSIHILLFIVLFDNLIRASQRIIRYSELLSENSEIPICDTEDIEGKIEIIEKILTITTLILILSMMGVYILK
jgi:hypothetical protein